MNTSHEINKENTTTTWLTPLSIIKCLGNFDLDPCTPPSMPWETAKKRYTEADDGLKQDWSGRVWLNPPYGKLMPAFLKKMAEHNYGTALTFARTDTKQFHDYVFPFASALLFKEGRIKFCNGQGVEIGQPGAASVFIAYGNYDANILEGSGIKGKFIRL